MATKRAGQSTAQVVDRAFKALCKLRKRFGFPQVGAEAEVHDTWMAQYDMGRPELALVRQHVAAVAGALGRVPWQHDPEAKE